MTNIPKLVLGSGSRYRREMLERLGVPFETCSPDIDEASLPGETPLATCRRLSILKARAVAAARPGCVVIGCDQVADLEGTKLGKPHTRERAIEQLEAMQGKALVFHSAMTVIAPDGAEQTAVVPTTVRMKALKRETIEAYVDIEQPFDCAGAAKIEKLGVALMDSVESDDPTALIGLPLIELVKMLARAGLPVLPGL